MHQHIEIRVQSQMKAETFVFEFTPYEIFLITSGLKCLASREHLIARIAEAADNIQNAVASKIIATDAQNLISTLTK